MDHQQNRPIPRFIFGVVKVGDRLEWILSLVGGSTIIVFVCSVFLDVAARELAHPISWCQEIALFTYIWAIFTGSAIGIRHGTHFTIDLIVNQIQGKLRHFLDLVAHIIIFIFVLVLAYYGWQYALVCLNRFSQPSNICMTWGTACMTVSAICMVYFCVEYFLLELWKTNLKQFKAMRKVE